VGRRSKHDVRIPYVFFFLLGGGNFITSTFVNSETFEANCTSDAGLPLEFQRVVFWYYAGVPQPLVTSVFCYPAVELWNVNVSVDAASGNVTSVTPLQQITNFNTTGFPPAGRAYNGLDLNNYTLDVFGQQRQTATQLQLPAAVLNIAEATNSFTEDSVTQLTNTVYVRQFRFFFLSRG
jgi:hypothetical protein